MPTSSSGWQYHRDIDARAFATCWLGIGSLLALLAQVLVRRSTALAPEAQPRTRVVVSRCAGCVAVVLSAIFVPWAVGVGPLALVAPTDAWRFVAAAVASSALFVFALLSINPSSPPAERAKARMAEGLARRDFLKWADDVEVLGGCHFRLRGSGL